MNIDPAGLQSIIVRGGPIVDVLIVMSVIGLTIFLDRLWHFSRMGKIPFKSSQDPEGAFQSWRKERGSGPESRLISALEAAQRRGVSDHEAVARRVGNDEVGHMSRGMRTLDFIATTAPLVGLLGTITGLIKAFMVIEQAGGRVDASLLAGGIWEAMITTAVGLVVAIATLFMHHRLESLMDRRIRSMKRCAMLFIERHADTQGVDDGI